MSKEAKNVLIFGAGSIGTHHAHAARYCDCNVMICDINKLQFNYMRDNLYPERYKKWDKKITFIPYEDIFKTEKIFDLIILGVPPQSHLSLLQKCLKYLKFDKIMTEKPLCIYNQSFSFLKKNKHNDKLYCGFNHSLSDSIVFLKELVVKGRIGTINKIEINWKEDFDLILKAHPWIKSLSHSYLSNIKEGGGGCHEYSHAIHLGLMFRDIIFSKKGRLSSKIKYIDKKNIYYDSIAQLSFKEKKSSIDINIDTISNPPLKTIKLIGEKGIITWERRIEKNLEKIKIINNKTIDHDFKITRPDDFINQMRYLLLSNKNNSKIKDIKIESAIEVMNILKKIFK